jgi:DNA-binding response OmpR family regulator
MSINAKIRVMALGNTLTLKRLNACTVNNGVDIVGLSQTPEAIALLQSERFDVVLIDSLLEEAANACRYICDIACIPIAILVRETEANWQKLCSWEVDGFVPEESSKIELVARIKAISRRCARDTGMVKSYR